MDTAPKIDVVTLLPADWRAAMRGHLDTAEMAKLSAFVAAEYAAATVYPPRPDLYRAFRLCPLDRARVLILGQDPYHGAGQAHGLSFSVPAGVAAPPSLRNVFREIGDDLQVAPPSDPDLSRWAEQGVLLLNTVLTVRAGRPASHAGHGWERLSDAAILALNELDHRVVFLLWGQHARRKATLITADRHVVLESGHPSPMNPRGFLGTRPFSTCNRALVEAGLAPIDWT